MSGRLISCAKRFFFCLLLMFFGAAALQAQEAEKKTATIGVTLALTGPLAEYGEWMQRGMLMAAEDIRSSGGPELKFDFQDDVCLAAKAVSNVKQFLSTRDYSYLSSLCTAVAPAIAPISAKKAVLLTPAFKFRPLNNPAYGHFFSLQPAIEREMQALAAVLKRKGFQKLAILANEDDFVESYVQALKQVAAKSGIEIVSEQRPLITEADYKVYLPKLEKSGAEVVFLSFRPPQYQVVIDQIRTLLGRDVALAGNWTMSVVGGLPIPPEHIEGALFTYHYKVDGSKRSAEFARRYEEKFGVPPEVIAASSYDIASLFAQALDACDSKDIACTTRWLNDLVSFEGASGAYEFENGASTKKIYPMTFSGGKMVELKK